MKLLYLGAESGTSGHRVNALKRLGHDLTLVNPAAAVAGFPMAGSWQRYMGSVGFVSLVRQHVLRAIQGQTFDLVWVDSGPLVSPALILDLQKQARKVINYNVDDPYGTRDANYWFQYKRAVRVYDMMVVVREENIAEAKQLGARRVLHVFRSADEVAHAQRALTDEEMRKWASEVLFVGTAFPERGAFFAELIRLGVPVSILGGQWQNLKEWKKIEPHWKGPAVNDIYGYNTAVQAAKVLLGLLSTENRDLHTTRTMEIPSMGGVFCAQRTREHLALYKEDEEAVFWDDPAECAAKCFALLANEEWRLSVGRKGHERYLKNGWTNQHLGEIVLTAAFE